MYFIIVDTTVGDELSLLNYQAYEILLILISYLTYFSLQHNLYDFIDEGFENLFTKTYALEKLEQLLLISDYKIANFLDP